MLCYAVLCDFHVVIGREWLFPSDQLSPVSRIAPGPRYAISRMWSWMQVGRVFSMQERVMMLPCAASKNESSRRCSRDFRRCLMSVRLTLCSRSIHDPGRRGYYKGQRLHLNLHMQSGHYTLDRSVERGWGHQGAAWIIVWIWMRWRA